MRLQKNLLGILYFLLLPVINVPCSAADKDPINLHLERWREEYEIEWNQTRSREFTYPVDLLEGFYQRKDAARLFQELGKVTGQANWEQRAKQLMGTRISNERVDPKAIIEKHTFVVNRDLTTYFRFLGPDFEKHLLLLGDQNHWMDGGCGDAHAIKGYLSKASDRAANVTGVTLKYRGASSSNHKLNILKDRYFEDIPLGEITSKGRGPVDVISDLFGIFMYSSRVDLVLHRYVDLLKDNFSAAYIYVGQNDAIIIGKGHQIAEGIPQGIVFTRDGKTLTIAKWIEALPLDVRIIDKNFGNVLIIKRKIGSDVVIPKLRLRHLSGPRTPLRVFEETKEDLPRIAAEK